mgnify:CR=1 FL=1
MAGRYELGDLVWRVTGDTKDFDKSIDKSQSRLQKFSDKAIGAGKKFSTFLTAPLIGAGVAATKAASDLEESQNAVNVVFNESAKTIHDFGETAAESAGLSQSSFNELATVIGAQLKQSGLAMDTVADETVNLTQRAADLASVFNTDVKDASQALGAALRGETEPARRFGINISAAAVQAEALASGLIDSKDEMTEQIKIQARLNLIMKQSKQVQGDFANTSDSLANSTRITKAQLEDAAAQLGENLIPIAKEAVDVVNDLVTWFNDLDESGEKTVLTIGALAAGIGPLLVGIGNVTKAIRVLNTTVLFGPVGLIAAATAAGVALAATADEAERAESAATQSVSGMNQSFSDLQSMADGTYQSTEEVARQAEIMGQRYEAMAESTEKARARDQKRLEILEKYSEKSEEYRRAQEKADRKEQARIEGVIEARKTATESYNQEIDLIQRKAELDLMTAEETREAKIEAEEAFQEQLLEIGYDGLENEQEQLDIGDEQLRASIERRKQLQQGLENNSEKTQLNITKDQKDALKKRYQAWNDFYNDVEKDDKDLEKKLEDTAEKYVKDFTSAFTSVGEALVNQKNAWEAVGQAALGTIAEILRALGAQLAAQAAALYVEAALGNLGKIPGAVAATAASAAAYTAAGAVEASAQEFQEGGFVQPRPGTSDQGDQVPARLNPREVVLTESDATELLSAIRGGKMGGVTVNQYNTLNTDSEKNLQRAARQLYPYMDREERRRG